MQDFPHEMAGKKVRIIDGEFVGQIYKVEDWQDRVFGRSWIGYITNPACLEYMIRRAKENTPIDDLVLYGHIGAFGKIIHISQIGAEVKQ
jgi:hypothetical protein